MARKQARQPGKSVVIARVKRKRREPPQKRPGDVAAQPKPVPFPLVHGKEAKENERVKNKNNPDEDIWLTRMDNTKHQTNK